MKKHGFDMIWEDAVKELDSIARLWRHKASGAELLSFMNADENKVFGVSFRTPPSDSTGVAHILEHSVLCGSEKYPVKEPFVELLKGSLQTFLNAFTYPDKTCYPVASANLKDFRNLTDVYLDAVFFPRITEDIFRQEGWHLEAGDNGDFVFKGVVYNEMKGAFSAPESVLERYCLHAVFPDNAYALESGGDPADIPSLTYQAFRDFHARYYHPSNACFFFWGDDAEDERLEQLGAVLNRFTSMKPESFVALQRPINAPRLFKVPFIAPKDESKGMVVVNWLGPDVMRSEDVLAFNMLEHILLGMPASPLRRALIESGLGEDLAGSGLETELRQLVFSAGLKGILPDMAGQAEALVLETLERLASDGIPGQMVEAAVNSVEFALRENNSGRFPVGLAIMLRSLTSWLHGGNPLTPLRFEEPLKNIKNALTRGEPYFENRIRSWLLENTHRVAVVLVPDAALGKKSEDEEKARVKALTAPMTGAQRKTVLLEAEKLFKLQAQADSPEALATIPKIGVADLPLENSIIPTERLERHYPLALFHPLPTSGIVYVEAAFDLSAVPEYLLPLLPLFGRALLEMGTRQRDFVELNMAIAGKTGGMDVDTLFLTNSVGRAAVARMVLSGKAAPDRVNDLFGLMIEVLADCDFDQPERFLRMTLEEKARQGHRLVPAGHVMVATRLGAALSVSGMLAEYTDGVSCLPYLRQLAERIENDWPSVLQDLEFLRRSIIHRAGLAVNLTATDEQREALEGHLQRLVRTLPEQSVDGASSWQDKVAELPEAEALILPASVNYVGKAVNLFDHGYEWHGSASVVIKYLRTGYLWEKVRVQGGAYGCMCGMDRMSGSFHMVSYRDPNILPTLNSYDEAARHIAGYAIGKEELEAAIVGTIGELDAYLLPDAKGSAAFIHMLNGDSIEQRQQLREEILGTTAEQFKKFGQALEAFSAKGRVCALGGDALEAVGKKRGWHIERVL